MPKPNIEPSPGEPLDEKRLREIFKDIQRDREVLRRVLNESSKVAGRVKSTGEKEAGEGFAVEKTATGTYKVTLAASLGDAPAWTATAVAQAFDRVAAVNPTSATVCTITIRDTGATAQDTAFHFQVEAT